MISQSIYVLGDDFNWIRTFSLTYRVIKIRVRYFLLVYRTRLLTKDMIRIKGLNIVYRVIV